MFFIKKHISIKQQKYYLNAKFNAKAYAIFEKKLLDIHGSHFTL